VQSAGRIPLRKAAERGYRSGADPDQQWTGLIPFEAMPHAVNPDRGWLATANNRLAGDDYPYPLFGTWSSGYRAARIRQMIESRLAGASRASERGFTADDFRKMHQDTLSLRAVACVPPLLAVLSDVQDNRIQEAVEHLRRWDGRAESDLAAPAIFNVFFALWAKAVADVRFDSPTAALLAKQAEGLASRLLAGDAHGWFADDPQRVASIRRVFGQALAKLMQRFGHDMSAWQWGRVHQMPLKHVLSFRGDLGELLSHGGGPISGDMNTVCNTGSDPALLATTGAGYRLIADLATDRLLAVDAQSQSGASGSPHYSDQFDAWKSGEYHVLPLHADEVAKIATSTLTLQPAN